MIDRNEIRRLREQGVPPVQIAQMLGCSESSVQKIAKQMGLARAVGQRHSAVDLPRLFELWATQASVAEIANELGVSKTTVWSLKIRHKLPNRPTHPKCFSQLDVAPSPSEEAASLSGLALSPWVEERAKVVREKHYLERRREPDETARSKAAAWRRGDYTPRGAHHERGGAA